MYQDRVKAVKQEGILQLVVLPLILGIVVMNMVFPLVADMVGKLIFPPAEDIITPGMVFSYAFSLALSIILAMLVNKASLKDLGLGKQGAGKQALVGAFFGFAAISIVSLLINFLGGVQTTMTFKGEYMGFILLALCMFIFQSTFEEFVYRSYLLPMFSKKFGDGWSIIITSVLFVLLHAMNGGMGPIPVVNLFLAGVVFSLVYYNWGSLWLCGLAHALWNFSQGVIYGSLVSGNPLGKSVMTAIPVEGMDIISGAAFGFEGSIITSVIGVLIVLGLMVYAKKKGKPLSFTRG